MKKFFAISAAILASSTFAQAQDTVDTQSPTITMEAPVNGVESTTNRVTVTGEATDDVGVTSVYYRIEGKRRWRKAILTNPGETSTTYVFSFKNSRKGRATRIYVRAFDAAKNESDIIGRKSRRSRSNSSTTTSTAT